MYMYILPFIIKVNLLQNSNTQVKFKISKYPLMNRQEKDQQQQIQVTKPAEKRTRKNKAQISKASKSSHMTRRRQQPDSSEQNLLPSQIPQTSGTQPIVTSGTQNELGKVLIRIPFTLIVLQKMYCQSIIQVQSKKIQIKIEKQLDNVTISAKCYKQSSKIQIEPLKQKYDENQIDIDQSNSFSQDDNVFIINIWGKYVYLAHFQSQNKVIKKGRKQLNSVEDCQIIKFKVKQVNSDFFVYLNLRAEQFPSDKHNGLINQGNTCYMNSYLQTLYHIPAFRNLVYQAQIQDQEKFPATLQELFFNLEKSEKPVSPEFLVKSFGWGKRQASIQQDAQQFSCLFFQALQRKLNDSAPKNGYKNLNIQNLFKGTLNHYLRCTQVGTKRKL